MGSKEILYVYECRKCGFKGSSDEFQKPYGSFLGNPWPPFPNFRCPKCNNHAVDSLIFIEENGSFLLDTEIV